MPPPALTVQGLPNTPVSARGLRQLHLVLFGSRSLHLMAKFVREVRSPHIFMPFRLKVLTRHFPHVQPQQHHHPSAPSPFSFLSPHTCDCPSEHRSGHEAVFRAVPHPLAHRGQRIALQNGLRNSDGRENRYTLARRTSRSLRSSVSVQ